MMSLTRVQKELLLHIGNRDDGSQMVVVTEIERTIGELMKLGLVYYGGKDTRGRYCYHLTDAGEREYAEQTGEMIR